MYKSTKVVFFSIALSTLIAASFGCGPAANTSNVAVNVTTTNTATRPNSSPAATPANTAGTNAVTSNSSTTASADKIGIAECDEYIEKWEACVLNNPKYPEAGRAAAKSAFDQMRNGWKTSVAAAANSPQAKSAIASGCKQAMETAKTTFAAYSCEW